MVNKFLPIPSESSHFPHSVFPEQQRKSQWKRRAATACRVETWQGGRPYFLLFRYLDEESCAIESNVSALMPAPEEPPVRIDSAGDVDEVVLFWMSYIAVKRCSNVLTLSGSKRFNTLRAAILETTSNSHIDKE